MKKIFKDFKEFITRGNVVELAIAVIIGGAFGKIVNSMVNDIVMPLIGVLIGGVDVSDWKWVIKAAEINTEGIQTAAEVAVRYGIFIQAIIDFLIIAFFIFLMLKVLKNARTTFETATGKLMNITTKQLKEIEKKLKKMKKSGASEEEISQHKQLLLEKIETTEQEKPEDVIVEKIETTEDILKDIRSLLKQQNEDKEVGDKD